MFPKLVSNLEFVPGLGSQLTFYVRRLKNESITRKLSVVIGVALALFQVAAWVAPPLSSVAASTNDVIFGGFTTQQQLLTYYDHGLQGHQSASELQALFNRFGITRSDLAATSLTSISTSNHSWLSIGRNAHFAQDQPFTAGGDPYYLRPLYLWDAPGTTSSYQVLAGHSSINGQFFAVMLRCGNLVFNGQPQVVNTPPPPPPKPGPPPPPPPIPTNPNITLAKQATYAATGLNANNTVAKAGDEIVYSLLAKNIGDGAQINYQVAEDINDVLEYATPTDLGGGTLTGGTISWPTNNIAAGDVLVRRFTVKVKSPIPATPQSFSDPNSFDLRMDNYYGNLVSIRLPAPLPKQVERTKAKLPQTGAGLNTTIVLLFVALCVYFYSRNRQLITEVNLLRAEQAHGGGQ